MVDDGGSGCDDDCVVCLWFCRRYFVCTNGLFGHSVCLIEIVDVRIIYSNVIEFI